MCDGLRGNRSAIDGARNRPGIRLIYIYTPIEKPKIESLNFCSLQAAGIQSSILIFTPAVTLYIKKNRNQMGGQSKGPPFDFLETSRNPFNLAPSHLTSRYRILTSIYIPKVPRPTMEGRCISLCLPAWCSIIYIYIYIFPIGYSLLAIPYCLFPCFGSLLACAQDMGQANAMGHLRDS